MHRQDPRLRVALLCAENLPRMATVGECWVYVQLRVGKHVMKSSPGLWPHPEFYEEFDLVARGLTLTLTVHQKGLLGLLAGPQICEFCLPDIHALLRDEEVPVSLTSLEFPETVLHIRVLPMHSGMDVACLQQLDGEERAGRPLVVEEEAAEFVDLLREFWDCATELQHIGRAKARLLRVEEAERHQLTAEYECFAAQGEPQHWLSFIALLLEEECVRQRLTGEVVDVLVTAHRYWEEQIQQMVDDTTARQAWEAYCLAALRLLWDEFRHRLDVRTTEVLQRRAWGVWRLTTWREEAERQQLRLAATYDRHKSLLVAEHVGRGAVAQASSPEWQQLALACVVEEEAVRRGEEELRWLVKRWALDRQAVEEEEAHRQQALALLERLLSVETAEERLRENLAVDFISQLLRPPLEHCLAIEATLRQEVAAEWAAALAVQRITWEAELTVLEEQWRRPQLEEQAEQSVGLVGEYGRGTLTVAEEEETCWGHLWKEVEAARRVVDFPLLETVARQELQEKWLSQWWEKRKRCAVFSLEVRNRMLLVELYCAEVTERRALGMLCVSEHSVAEHVMDERLVREAIVREENTAHPWLERVGLLLEEMAERGSAFLRFVEPCLAAIRSQEEEQWTSIWREGMNECARLHLLLDEAAERQETLRLEAGIFHCLREAARAGVAAIHQAQREKMRAEEEAERSSLAAAEDWRRQRVFQLALETMPLQICLARGDAYSDSGTPLRPVPPGGGKIPLSTAPVHAPLSGGACDCLWDSVRRMERRGRPIPLHAGLLLPASPFGRWGRNQSRTREGAPTGGSMRGHQRELLPAAATRHPAHFVRPHPSLVPRRIVLSAAVPRRPRPGSPVPFGGMAARHGQEARLRRPAAALEAPRVGTAWGRKLLLPNPENRGHPPGLHVIIHVHLNPHPSLFSFPLCLTSTGVATALQSSTWFFCPTVFLDFSTMQCSIVGARGW
eukprot:GGOE01008471.1.p1 GENE.GGOE01008471.1~~GGOE01008471.1.p1  ORF type:complete len:962 (-),score=233.06 GGOE01008471.1:339-3224(-)